MALPDRAGYDRLIDTVAAVCAADDPAAVAAVYASEDLTVPAHLFAWHRSGLPSARPAAEADVRQPLRSGWTAIASTSTSWSS
jgi:hypothetical protein